MVLRDPDIREEQMPGDMRPQPGMGDVEEGFIAILEDMNMDPTIPGGIDDGEMLEGMKQEMCETRDACRRVGQETRDLGDIPDPDPKVIVAIDSFDAGTDEFEVGFQDFDGANP